MKADIEARDELGCTPLMCASANGALHALRVLLQYGAQTDPVNNEGQRAIDLAVVNGHTDAERALRKVDAFEANTKA